MKKTFSILLVMVLMVSMLTTLVFADAPVSGGYDDEYGNIQWSYDTVTKTLTVTGTGELHSAGRTGEAEHVVIGEGITEISLSFESSLKTVSLPDTLEIIGTEAFMGTSVSSVVIPDGVKCIERSAFAMCDQLVSVTLPSTLIEIGDFAFYNTSIIAADLIGVKSIGDSAFAHCADLEFVTLSDNMEFIGGNAFEGTPFLDSLRDDEYACYAGKYLLSLGTEFNRAKDRSVKSGTTLIAENVIENNEIQTLTVPASVKYICDDHIEYRLIDSDDSEASLNIEPRCVDTICFLGTQAQWAAVKFSAPENCDPEIVIMETEPDPVDNTDPDYAKKPEDANKTSGSYSREYGTVEWIYDTDTKTLTVTGTGKLVKDGWPRNAVENVIVGEGITELGMYLFNEPQIKTVSLPDTLEVISLRAFAGTASLKQITIPTGVRYIDFESFAGSGIESVVIPEGITSIKPAAFYHCDNLVTVTLPSTLTEIGDCAFYKSGALKSVTVPASVTSIGDAAFADCISLKDVLLPKNITFIGRDVFDNTEFIDSCLEDGYGYYSGRYLLDLGYVENEDERTVKNGTTLIAEGVITDRDSVYAPTINKVTVPVSVKNICNDFYTYYIYYDKVVDYVTELEHPACIKNIDYLGTQAQWDEVDFDIKENYGIKVNVLGHDHTFKDVKAGAWYVNAVEYCYYNSFISGMSDTEFGVNTPVTRGMFITVLARMSGVDTNNNDVKTKFTDVESGRFYTNAIKWASENGIVAGMTESTYAPNSPLQRQQLCLMIVNFAKYHGIEIKTAEDEMAFADGDTVANWAKAAVKTCQMADIINGYNEGGSTLVKPTATATRAEAAQILYKFHKDFVA